MTTDEIKQLSVYERLLGVMGDLPYLEKEDKRVNNQYRFASYDTLALKLQPLLVKWRLVCITDLADWSQDGNRTTAIVKVSMVSVDAPTERVEVTSLGYGVDNQDKGPGKALTYGAKNGLLKMLNVPCGEDPERDLIDHVPGNASADTPAEPKPDIGKFRDLTGEQLAYDLQQFCEALGWDRDSLRAHAKQFGKGRDALVLAAQDAATRHIKEYGTPDPNILVPESTEWLEVYHAYRMAALEPDDPDMSEQSMQERAIELWSQFHQLEPAGA
jgi:hypothetical protein